MIQYELEYHHDQQLIISRVEGKMLPDETAQMGLNARSKAKELDYKLLVDFSVTLPNFPT